MSVKNWSGPAETVRLGYDLPRIHVIDGEHIWHSRGDLREQLGYTPRPTRDRRPDLRQTVLDQQARARAKAAKPPKEKHIRWGWIVAVIFAAIMMAQVVNNDKPGFVPHSVPISTITAPSTCGEYQIVGVTLESPASGVSQTNIYEVTCSSGEQLAVLQR